MRSGPDEVSTQVGVRSHAGVVVLEFEESIRDGDATRKTSFGVTMSEAIEIVEQLNLAIAASAEYQDKIATAYHKLEMQRQLTTSG